METPWQQGYGNSLATRIWKQQYMATRIWKLPGKKDLETPWQQGFGHFSAHIFRGQCKLKISFISQYDAYKWSLFFYNMNRT
jgi:hypothetical protein